MHVHHKLTCTLALTQDVPEHMRVFRKRARLLARFSHRWHELAVTQTSFLHKQTFTLYTETSSHTTPVFVQTSCHTVYFFTSQILHRIASTPTSSCTTLVFFKLDARNVVFHQPAFNKLGFTPSGFLFTPSGFYIT